MKYFSAFSGIGGFELPLKNFGHKCIGFSEIDQCCLKVYNNHFNHEFFGGIEQVNGKEIRNFDLLVGGTPCQNFTILGDRKGLSGGKSRLFYYFTEMLKEKKPSYFVFENVKGALSSNNGWDFACMQIEFYEAGYDIQWDVLNTKFFGLPQNRERLFVVGNITGKSRPKVFPFRASKEDSEKRKIVEMNSGFHRYRTYSKFGISPTITSYHRAGYAGVKVEFDSGEIRYLTPIEYERVQGFPDNWTQGCSDIDRYTMLGNAVSVKVAEFIIKGISDHCLKL